MRKPHIFCLAFMAIGAPAVAQEMTDEELLSRFQQQRDAIRAAEEGNLGGTRGITIETIDDMTTEPELAEEPTVLSLDTPEPEAAAPAEGFAEPAADPVQTASAPPADEMSIAVIPADSDLGVNVQVNFPFDSASLTEDQVPKLSQLCNVMQQAGDINLFRIVGHTDSAGSDEYNERLSLLRAQEVRRHFVNTCGIAPERLEAVGMGERFLADPDDPASADNRRVEFQALS